MNAVVPDPIPSFVPSVSTDDFVYELPEDRIATHPRQNRERSRLLVCDAGSGQVEHRRFDELAWMVPPDAMLVLNDTKVVRARIVLHKETGGRVEFMLLEPVEPSPDPAVALAARHDACWNCMIGGVKKLRSQPRLHARVGEGDDAIEITAIVEERLDDCFRVRFRWSPPERTFGEVLERAGRMPLPPYIKRESTPSDVDTYQTVYAQREGAVAAPTAGLHFTPQLLDRMASRGVSIGRVTLHVGAGTFKQVESGRVDEHVMHRERISVTAEVLQMLAEHARLRQEGTARPFVMVGTTSLRTVESLYWFGARLMLCGESRIELSVDQWDPYRLADEHASLPSAADALQAVVEWHAALGGPDVSGHTGLFIVPGYEFRACDALITNFHQPGSTLILLVGAFLGRELWRRAYDQALGNGYRFLSYGDSSLLIGSNGRFSLPESQ